MPLQTDMKPEKAVNHDVGAAIIEQEQHLEKLGNFAADI